MAHRRSLLAAPALLPAPSGTPVETIAPIHADTAALLHRADITARHQQLGTAIWTSTPAETTRFIGAEMSRSDETARAIGLQREAAPA